MRHNLLANMRSKSKGKRKGVGVRGLIIATTAGLALTTLAACSGSSDEGTAETGAVTTTSEATGEDTLARMQDSGYARLSSYQQPPHGWFDGNEGVWKGVDVEIIEAMLPKLGVESWDYTVVDWGGMIPGLQGDRWDIMSIGMSNTKERSEQVGFSTPLYKYGEGLVVQAGNPKAIKGSAQYPGLRIGGILGSTSDAAVIEAGGEFVGYQKYSDMYADIAAGRIDGGLVDEMQGTYDFSVAPQPKLEILNDYEGKIVYPTSIVMRTEDVALQDKINSLIAEMQADGSLDAILAKWGLTDVNKVTCTTVTYAENGVAVC